MKNKMPFVSVVIPCRNEEKFIGRCLDSIVRQDYPKESLEILIVDGMSDDNTKKIIEEYSGRYHFIKYLENRLRITPCALNIGIKNSEGQIIARMDAHAVYREDYISKCIKYLDEFSADNAGGAIITLPINDTFIGKSIVNVLSSRFGVGNSVFRTGSKEAKWVDTVFGGCYKKEIFAKIGLFNENLASTQDMEFNLRLKRSGGRILLHPDIVSYYYTRSDLKGFCRNNFRNGFWAVYPIKFTKFMPVSLRHLVPLFFVLSLLISVILSSFLLISLKLFIFIITFYAVSAFYFSGKYAVKEKDPRYLFVMPAIFFSLHFLYGFGSIWATIKLIFEPGERVKCDAGQ